ncbi:Copalyl diphosphate synthase [Annulohypoxylon maeteangense]|uniref:Copalyl diphosphate synthase n=1 Tax=Annulohypoxylon maeteangense TaxID=1927788 RepID=UPI0020088624|nr:Copalyl diphosphate synthase [Annulohypoxylon maeteangense]KAI0882025.1 Copalyl diphosphate synthase [Annulohypoxylon maeteangense]
MADTRSTDNGLNTRAIALIQRAIRGYDEVYGSGTMSCAPYDTAWVSMITKQIDGKKQWLFPECFQYLLQTQNTDGSWNIESNSQIDGILNTAASLLSLQRHLNEPLQIIEDSLEERIEKATTSLCSQLSTWSVLTTDHVGFEIIVPAMLNFLERENPLLDFEFEGKRALANLTAAKMSRFKPEYLYGKIRMTAIHSLEAFIGMIDFEKVAHHKIQGSMMGSPSATAAYLMNISSWDGEAEAYLRQVIKSAAGQGSGGVPSAYPSTYFEYTWILSTLLQGGFTASDLECLELAKMTQILARAFQIEKGVIGFAPHVGADVDDTAKGILCLGMLGNVVAPDQMIVAFEAENHFRTYPSERDPSFSANCNALMALIHQPDARPFAGQILKIVRFLCDTWWNTDGRIKDKWNTNHLYPSVLVVEAFAGLLALIDSGALADLIDEELLSRISIVFVQACLRTILGQSEDGSWDNTAEQTAHGVLILCEARKSGFFDSIREHLDSAINHGVNFLLSSRGHVVDYCWIEKVSYASPLLTEAYVLSALKASTAPFTPRLSIGSKMVPKISQKHVQLFRQTPLFSSLPEFEVKASLIEAALFQPLLRPRRLLVFPRKDMEEDKYFDIIPFTWTACNNRSRTFAPTTFLYEMMIISFLNYQADEFMEAVAGPSYTGNLDGLRKLIDDTINGIQVPKITTNGVDPPSNSNGKTTSNGSTNHDDVSSGLTRFIEYVLNHPSVTSASPWSRKSLKWELRTFLRAHVSQTEDNLRFSSDIQQSGDVYSSANETFFQWVRSTSADHTSCPYAFSFVSCLLSSSLANGEDCFATAGEKYLAADVCRHLATMCRMYNDYGSVLRDEAEGNLNSVNFPDFEAKNIRPEQKIQQKKDALFKIAEYERSCLETAFKRLQEENKNATDGRGPDAQLYYNRRMVIWGMFCDVTDLYGQLYVVRDLASRMVKSGTNGA